MATLRQAGPGTSGASVLSGARPVMLATFGVPFDERASAFAVETALEGGQALILVNVVELPLAPAAVFFGYDGVEDPPELARALRAPAELAGSLGVRVERLRVKSPHRVDALLEVVSECEPGLLVLGPDVSRLRGRLYRRAAKAVRERAPCLVWLPE